MREVSIGGSKTFALRFITAWKLLNKLLKFSPVVSKWKEKQNGWGKTKGNSSRHPKKTFFLLQIMKVNNFHLHNALTVIGESQTAVMMENVYDFSDKGSRVETDFNALKRGFHENERRGT
jgi:hypothetical protein